MDGNSNFVVRGQKTISVVHTTGMWTATVHDIFNPLYGDAPGATARRVFQLTTTLRHVSMVHNGPNLFSKRSVCDNSDTGLVQQGSFLSDLDVLEIV